RNCSARQNQRGDQAKRRRKWPRQKQPSVQTRYHPVGRRRVGRRRRWTAPRNQRRHWQTHWWRWFERRRQGLTVEIAMYWRSNGKIFLNSSAPPDQGGADVRQAGAVC